QLYTEQSEAKQLLNKEEAKYEREKRQYDQLEFAWIENQAVVLASHLHDGEPCPVCGSASHPHKATSNETEVTRTKLNEAKKQTDQAHKTWMNATASYESFNKAIQNAERVLIENDFTLENLQEQRDKIVKDGKEIKTDIEKIDQQLEQNKVLKKSQEELEKRKEHLTEIEKTIQSSLQEKQTAYAEMNASFKERIREIPEELQVLENLKSTLRQREQHLKNLTDQWKQAEENLKKADSAYTTEKANLQNIKEQLKQIEERLKEDQTTFTEKIATSNFINEEAYKKAKRTEEEQATIRQRITTYKEEVATLKEHQTTYTEKNATSKIINEEAYKKAKSTKEEQATIRKRITTYKEEVATKKKQIEELTTELVEKQPVDLDTLEDEVKTLQNNYELAVKQYNHSLQKHEQIKDLHVNITELSNKTTQVEKDLAVVRDLYDVLREQNHRKISFERYVQIDYLDQITAAANDRFHDLSNGQFYLVRSDRQESHGKQSGLAIDVHDAYTGQTRDVKTLSGGEKFIASLCLALGMSDVIQRFQGSISIETMFIDEGFGSLDEESLHKAI